MFLQTKIDDKKEKYLNEIIDSTNPIKVKQKFTHFSNLNRSITIRMCMTERRNEVINQVILVGRLTKDPEIRYTADGAPVANITLAVSRQFRNAAGEIDTDFVNCTVWRRTAENTANYCRKGSIIGVTGRIQTRSYENAERVRVYVTEVVADSVRFMSGKPRELVEQES